MILSKIKIKKSIKKISQKKNISIKKTFFLWFVRVPWKTYGHVLALNPSLFCCNYIIIIKYILCCDKKNIKFIRDQHWHLLKKTLYCFRKDKNIFIKSLILC